MRLLIRFTVALTALIAIILGSVAWQAIPQKKFLSREMEWNWHWEYFLPFSNGIQVTRTKDTKQLLLRRVYLEESVVIFLGTTLDNKFEVDVLSKEHCTKGDIKWISVSVNHRKISHRPMECEASEESYLYRYISSNIKSIEVGINEFYLRETFSNWPVHELKSDQFRQQHSRFFKSKDGHNNERWLRD
ncbi:hypothetical protein [Vibrio sagamiensis]|uniref:Threonine transporter RhtB n=1 Tax=Vibrio sagamiensis NBRC 104589 TaxID=1219064 RepID=A0A511QB60_9VIBR|nr:hypothetical protein [Vibrio sagamiensis]PNQ54339.1 threonine transporter RhtB [Vibrio agarivorans]GEM74534.1 hypothetical protein VSA01S_06460 [Vibrio sagamiensis NBRC 104589]